jgi:hypothetical protein
MPGVRPVGLGALFRAAQPTGLRRLGQTHPRADPPQLLEHEPPTRRRLQGDLELCAINAQEPRHRLAMRRSDPRPAHLAGRGIDPLGGDLPRCWSSPITIVTRGPPQAPRLKPAPIIRASAEEALHMPSFESPSLGRQLVVVEDAVPVGVVGYGCVSLVTFDEDRSGGAACSAWPTARACARTGAWKRRRASARAPPGSTDRGRRSAGRYAAAPHPSHRRPARAGARRSRAGRRA